MTSKPTRPRFVTITASRSGPHIRLDWEAGFVHASGDKPIKTTRRYVLLRHPGEASVPLLTYLASRMALYVLKGIKPALYRVPATEWQEGGSGTWVVPRGPGEGGANSSDTDISRTADTEIPETPLPSVLPPSGAGGGGERSDLLSAVDPVTGQFVGQLELPLVDGA
jgi:hypothetical protein